MLAIWERAEASQTESKGGDNDGRGLYVKDYHMMAEIEAEGRGVGEVYEVPECFRGESRICRSALSRSRQTTGSTHTTRQLLDNP